GTSPSPAPDRREQDGPLVVLPQDCSPWRSGHSYAGPDVSVIPFRVPLHSSFGETGDATTSFGASFRPFEDGHLKDQADGFSQSLPAVAFGFELCPPFPRQAIELGLTPGLGLLPVSRQQAAVSEPVQRRIKRALRNLNYAARHLLEALRDRIPVNRTERNNFQNQQIQRALWKI